MDWIDVAIVIVVLVAALRGWRTGLLGQVGAIAGRVGGLLLGLKYAAAWSHHLVSAHWWALTALGLVLVLSELGASVGCRLGMSISKHLLFAPLRHADHALGLTIAVGGVLAALWLVAGILSNVSCGGVGHGIESSAIVHALNRYLPHLPASPLQSALTSISRGVAATSAACVR